MQMTRQFGEDHFERWPDEAAHQMTAACRSVRRTENRMRVDLRRRIVDGHVAKHREHLDLGVDRDLLILFAVPVEEGDDGARERADCRKLARAKAMLGRERREGRDGLVARRQHDDEGSQSVAIVEESASHRAII